MRGAGAGVSALPRPAREVKLEFTMRRTISAKELRATLPDIVRRARRGERFVVLYRSRPAFQVVPIDEDATPPSVAAEDDPLYDAPAVGRSSDGLTATDHDAVLYGRRR